VKREAAIAGLASEGLALISGSAGAVSSRVHSFGAGIGKQFVLL